MAAVKRLPLLYAPEFNEEIIEDVICYKSDNCFSAEIYVLKFADYIETIFVIIVYQLHLFMKV